MDHFTSPAPRRRDETQGRSLTRRSFLGESLVGALTLGAIGMSPGPSDAAAHSSSGPSPYHVPAKPASLPMTGARYVALLGGADKEPVHNGYIEARWREIAAGPLIEAIDHRVLVICPDCLFVSYAFVTCQVCLQWVMVRPPDVTHYLETLRDHDQAQLETIEEILTEQRIERAVDLFDGPESAVHWGDTLFVRDLLKAKAA